MGHRIRKMQTIGIVVVLFIMALTAVPMSVTADSVPPHLVVDKSVSPGTIYQVGTGSPDEATVTLSITGAGDTITSQVAIDIVFSIDSSGSMGYVHPTYGPIGNDPYGIRLQGAKDFIDELDSSQDKVGVVSWDSNIDWKYYLTSDFTAAKNKVDTIDSSGGTSLNAGLQGAIQVLDAGARTGTAHVIIFLTDGVGSYTYSGYTGSWADDAASKGYVIYAIGLGSAATGPLEDMADATGGDWFIADSADDLLPIYDEISESVTNIAGTNIVLTENLQPNMDYVSGSASIAPVSVVGHTLTWHIPQIVIGDTWTVTFDITSTGAGDNLPVDAAGSGITYTKYDSSIETLYFPQAYLNVIPPNLPPVADADGVYYVNEGSSVLLDASGSYDPDVGDTLTYYWDLDGDLVYGDEMGETPTVDWTSLMSYGIDDDGSYAVAVAVSDGLAVDTDGSMIYILNVAPTADAGPDQTVYAGDPVLFDGSFYDPGTQDTHTYEWDFDDGDTDDTTLTPTHVYPDAGTYYVMLTVVDDDGGVGYDVVEIEVKPIPITIDIKPGSWPNAFNLNPNGVTSIAVLTTDDFDAMTVDPTTVTIEHYAVPLRWSVEDVDGDGDLDMVFKFARVDLDLHEDTTSLTLYGKNLDGFDIAGEDAVWINPAGTGGKGKGKP